LGIALSGIGIGERAERLIVLVIFALVGYVWIGIYIILAIAVITFGQRYLYVAKAIQSKKNAQEKL
jgi:archaetidylinositol phosphate synthase